MPIKSQLLRLSRSRASSTNCARYVQIIGDLLLGRAVNDAYSDRYSAANKLILREIMKIDH